MSLVLGGVGVCPTLLHSIVLYLHEHVVDILCVGRVVLHEDHDYVCRFLN